MAHVLVPAYYDTSELSFVHHQRNICIDYFLRIALKTSFLAVKLLTLLP